MKRLEELRNFSLKQKYPPALIDDSITKIKCLNRPAIFKAHENNDKDNSQIPYVTTFNPHNPEIYPEIFINFREDNGSIYIPTKLMKLNMPGKGKFSREEGFLRGLYL